MSTKHLLLATAFAMIISLPAYATDAPPPSFDGTTGTNAVKPEASDPPVTTDDPAATASPVVDPAAPAANPVNNAAPDAATAPPTDVTQPSLAAEPAPATDVVPNTATVPSEPVPSTTTPVPGDGASATPSGVPADVPATSGDLGAPEGEPFAAPVVDPTAPEADPALAPAVMPAETATPAPETAPVVAPAETAVAAPDEPVKKKVSPPAKLSALSKKYDLMGLDTNGDKSLSKSEFTANGFANSKVFAAYDGDSNGKLTNSEINAYAANIERNRNR